MKRRKSKVMVSRRNNFEKIHVTVEALRYKSSKCIKDISYIQ